MTPSVEHSSDWENTAVRQHMTRLAQVAQATTSTVIITDVSGVIIWVNDSFTKLTGYEFIEACGRQPGELLQGKETDRHETARIGAAIRAREGVSAELINYAKNGEMYWVGMKIQPLINAGGTIDGFVAIEADITKRHEERAALELLTSRFNMATQAANIGVYEREANDGEVWWSDVMWDIFGQDRGSFTPTPQAWRDLIHPDDRERVSEVASKTGRTQFTTDLSYRIIRPDGAVRYLQSIGSSQTLSAIGRSRTAGVTLDVTARVESELREATLQQKLRESSHQAGMAEIATGVLHNVGNVLNSLGIAATMAGRELKALRLDRLEETSALIRSNRATLTQFLEEDARGKHLPDYLPALANQISLKVRAAQSELATVDSLLQHVREIVSAQQGMAKVGGLREPLLIHELADSALHVQAPELVHIEIVRMYDSLPLVVTDRHKLLQILVNLVGNARDAIQEQSLMPKRLVVQLTRDEDFVLVSVEDSGVGMSPDALGRLWRFGYTTKPSGHGFGLHNSANAARELGATLTAHSDGPGKGSRFTLRLPINAESKLSSGAIA